MQQQQQQRLQQHLPHRAAVWAHPLQGRCPKPTPGARCSALHTQYTPLHHTTLPYPALSSLHRTTRPCTAPPGTPPDWPSREAPRSRAATAGVEANGPLSTANYRLSRSTALAHFVTQRATAPHAPCASSKPPLLSFQRPTANGCSSSSLCGSQADRSI